MSGYDPNQLVKMDFEIRTDPSLLVDLLRKQMQPKYCGRELVQNSRDAGAKKIKFETGYRDGVFSLSCYDDGKGMTRKELNDHYLQLMSSGKLNLEDAVGRFGVGRISILTYDPDTWTVDTRAEDNLGYRLFFDKGLSLRMYELDPSDIPRKGTTVSITKATAKSEADTIRKEIKEGLAETCAYVKPKLTFDGRRMNRPFDIEGVLKTRFEDSGVRGLMAISRHDNRHDNSHILEGGILLEEGYNIFNAGANVLVDVDPSFGLEYPFGRNRIKRDEAFERLSSIVKLNGNRMTEKACKELSGLKEYVKAPMDRRMSINLSRGIGKVGRFFDYVTSPFDGGIEGIYNGVGRGIDRISNAIGDFPGKTLANKKESAYAVLIAGLNIAALYEISIGAAPFYCVLIGLNDLSYVASKTELFSGISHRLRALSEPAMRVLSEEQYIYRDYIIYNAEQMRLKNMPSVIKDVPLIFDIDWTKLYSMNDIEKIGKVQEPLYVAGKRSEVTDFLKSEGKDVFNSENRHDIIFLVSKAGMTTNPNETVLMEYPALSDLEKQLHDDMLKIQDGIRLGRILGPNSNARATTIGGRDIVVNTGSDYYKAALELYSKDRNKGLYAAMCPVYETMDDSQADSSMIMLAERLASGEVGKVDSEDD